MKRKIFILLFIAAAIIGAGWLVPKLIPNSGDKVLVLAVIVVGSGLVLSNLTASLLLKLFRVDQKSLSRQNRWAVNLGIVFTGTCFALVLNMIVAKPLSSFLFGHVSRRVFGVLDDLTGSLFGFFLFLSVFYVLLRLYEETIAKRAKRFSRQSFLQGGWKLVVKLLVGGVVVYGITMAISFSSWVRETEFRLQRARTFQFSERNDSIAIVFLYNEGKSHEWYFNAMHQLSKELQAIGARVILAPLPPGLSRSQSTVQAVGRISKLRDIVFAISPKETEMTFGPTADSSDLWVRHPVNNLLRFDWGVISAEKLQRMSWWSARYFPVGYRETEKGYPVPDAAILTVKKFLGDMKEARLSDDRRWVHTGEYQIGLHADGSAPIFNNLNVHLSPKVTASMNDNEKTLTWYDWGGGTKLTKQESIRRLSGKIVIVEPGEAITSFFQFGLTYAQIIHQILRRESVTPLDRLTPTFVAISILVSVGLFWAFNAWIASLVVIVFATGQASLVLWLGSHNGLVVELLPLVLAAWFSVGVFVFVRINHERSFLHVVEKQRALQELQTAHDMQLGLMPTNDPVMPGFDISGITKPAEEVGGDFFDYVWLDESKTRLGIAVADVSGKAMKAAMTAVLASGMVYRELGSKDTPKSILTKINKPLHLKTDKRIFVAMTFALVNQKSRMFSYSNAGQMLPLFKRNGELRYLEVAGPRLPLGVREDIAYEEASLKLKRGDVVVLFSDGIPEAMNEKRELLGFERFESLVKDLRSDLSARQLSLSIVERVLEFTKDTPQHDDMTVVVVKAL